MQVDAQLQGEYSTLFGMDREICHGILRMHGLLNQYLIICVMNHVPFEWTQDVVLFPVQRRDLSDRSLFDVI